MKILIKYILISLVAYSCQNGNYSKESKSSYEIGLEFYKQAMLDSGKAGFNEALTYFNESVNQDATNISSYYWKMNCEVKLGEIDSAYRTSIMALNVIGQKSHFLKPEFYAAIGIIEKRNGNEEAFIYNFSQAIKIFEERLIRDPKNIDSISNKALLLCSIEGKQSAFEFLNSVSVDEDWEQALMEVKDYIKDFDFDIYINGFFNQ